MAYALISNGIKDILVAQGVGVFKPDAALTDWNIVISRFDKVPNRMIVILDTAGPPPEPGLDINYPGIQVAVRGEPNGYVDTMTKCMQIRDVLLGRPSETVNGDVWASITMSSDIIPLGYDENERPQFTLNFQLIVHQGDLTNSHRDAS